MHGSRTPVIVLASLIFAAGSLCAQKEPVPESIESQIGKLQVQAAKLDDQIGAWQTVIDQWKRNYQWRRRDLDNPNRTYVGWNDDVQLPVCVPHALSELYDHLQAIFYAEHYIALLTGPGLNQPIEETPLSPQSHARFEAMWDQILETDAELRAAEERRVKRLAAQIREAEEGEEGLAKLLLERKRLNDELESKYRQRKGTGWEWLARESPQKSKGIHVVEATYGWNCRDVNPCVWGGVKGSNTVSRGNVTTHIQTMCDFKQRCDYTIDYRQIGDACRGCTKDYIVVWHCGDPEYQWTKKVGGDREAGHGMRVILSCPE